MLKEIKECFNTNLDMFRVALDRLRDCLRRTDDPELQELADDEDALLAMPRKVGLERVSWREPRD